MSALGFGGCVRGGGGRRKGKGRGGEGILGAFRRVLIAICTLRLWGWVKEFVAVAVWLSLAHVTRNRQ